MHIRCPHCQSPIELVDDVARVDFACPSCGSNFSLANDQTASHRAETKRIAHFELLEQVGLGGFGSVWKAQDTQLDRTVAVKLPRKDQLAPDEQEQFLREARAAAQLHHPNIVSVHEVGRDGDALYIVSDFVLGATLADWLESQRMSPNEAAQLMIGVCDAVHHAHERGVVHRDLKPGNIILDLEGRPHVTDFGLAKREQGEITVTIDGRVLGTPAYMSPEQARGEGHQADRRSDVYSLGVILFQLITGELPFRGNPRMLIVQILTDEPPSPTKLNHAVSRDLETICLKCLQKDPDRRYPTAQALAEDLQRLLAHEPIHARPIGRWERGWRWCHRQPIVAGLLAAVIGTLSIGIAVSSYFAWRESVQRTAALNLAADKTRLANENETLATKASQSASAALRERDASRQMQYAADVALSAQVWQSDDGTSRQIRDVLKTHIPTSGEPDLREFAWRWQWHLLDRGATVYRFQDRPVAATVTGDGQLVTLDKDDIVRTWRDGAMQPIHEQAMTKETTPKLGNLSRDGRHVTFVGEDGSLTIQDASTSKIFRRPGTTPGSWGIYFTRDGKLVWRYGEDQTVRLWDIETEAEQQPIKVDVADVTDVRSLELSNDGRFLFITSSFAASLFSRATAKTHLLQDGAARTLLYRGAISPDGHFAAVGNALGETMLWDTGTLQQLGPLRTPSAAIRLTFSSDSRYLAVGEKSGRVSIWSTDSRTLIRTLKGHEAEIATLTFSDDGRFLLSYDLTGVARIWDLHAEDVRRMEEPVGAGGVAYSPNGRWLASGGQRGVRLRELASGDVVQTLDELPTRTIAFSPDSALLAAGGESGDIRLWEMNRGQAARVLPRPPSASIEVGMLHFSADSKSLVAAHGRPTAFGNVWPGTVNLWDMTSDTLLQSVPKTTEVSAAAVSHDGTKLAFATHGGEIAIWDLKTWRPWKEWQVDKSPGYASILFSPDDHDVIVGSLYGNIETWDVQQGRLRRTLQGHADAVSALAVSPDGKTLATGSWDHSIKLWHVATGRELRTVRAHASWVYCLDFSPDGASLASGGIENTIVLLEAGTLGE